jgi:hypothetical protein
MLHLTAEDRVHVQGSPCEICGRQSGTGTDFSPSSSVLSSQYHSAAAPHSLIYHLGDGLGPVSGRSSTYRVYSLRNSNKNNKGGNHNNFSEMKSPRRI